MSSGSRPARLRQWRQEDMMKALEEVRSGTKKASAAARDNGVPRKTLCDRLHKKVDDDCKLGGPTILTEEQEKSLCGYIEYMASQGFPLTINQVIMFAWCIDKSVGGNKFGETGPCYGWWLKFKRRHPEAIKLRVPECLDKGRATFSTANVLRGYFQLLKTVMEENSFFNRPEDIWNCDETVVDLNKSCQKVVVPRRATKAHSRQLASTEHISVHCAINAGGGTMPPFIIFKKSFPGRTNSQGGPDGAR